MFRLLFILAFGFNFIWEFFHSKLYVAYKGAPITLFILLRAALFDAAVIMTLYMVFTIWENVWLSVLLALLFAIGLELFALKTGRWEYKSSMPIIPFLKVGLTPVVQLPLLTYLAVKIMELKR